MPAQPFVTITNNWPSIDIGRMRHAITIQQMGTSSPPVYDASGPSLTASTFTTAMAAIETVRGTDVIRSGQATTQLFLTVGMWYQPGILPNMTVLSDNGSRYVIQSVENILEMNVVLILNCLALGSNE